MSVLVLMCVCVCVCMVLVTFFYVKCVYFDSANAFHDKTDEFQQIWLAWAREKLRFIAHLVRYFIGFDYVHCAHHHYISNEGAFCVHTTKPTMYRAALARIDAQYARFVYCNRVPLKLKSKFSMNTLTISYIVDLNVISSCSSAFVNTILSHLSLYLAVCVCVCNIGEWTAVCCALIFWILALIL